MADDLDQEVRDALASLPRPTRERIIAWVERAAGSLDLARSREAGDSIQQAAELAIARERARLAREIHDGLAADIASAIALLKYYLQLEPSEPDREGVVRNVLEILEKLLQETREWLHSMRSSPVETMQLVEAVRALAEEYGQIHGIRVEIWSSGSQEQLTAAQREVTYHVIREALTNIRRHAGANVCRVRLAFDGMPFLVEISDEGRGFVGGVTSGYGLIGMRERAVGIGCRLEIVTTVDRGTRVFLFGPTPFS